MSFFDGVTKIGAPIFEVIAVTRCNREFIICHHHHQTSILDGAKKKRKIYMALKRPHLMHGPWKIIGNIGPLLEVYKQFNYCTDWVKYYESLLLNYQWFSNSKLVRSATKLIALQDESHVWAIPKFSKWPNPPMWKVTSHKRGFWNIFSRSQQNFLPLGRTFQRC